MSDNSLLEKLETFYIRFREIGQLITDPEVIQDMNRFVKLNKEYRDLEQIVEAGDELKRAVSSYRVVPLCGVPFTSMFTCPGCP